VIGCVKTTGVARRLLVALQKKRPKIVRRKKLHSFMAIFHSNLPYLELCDMLQAHAGVHLLQCAV